MKTLKKFEHHSLDSNTNIHKACATNNKNNNNNNKNYIIKEKLKENNRYCHLYTDRYTYENFFVCLSFDQHVLLTQSIKLMH